MKIEEFPGGKVTKQTVWVSYVSKNGVRVKKRSHVFVLTDEQRAWLCRWFPELENSEIERITGMTRWGVLKNVRELGLVKSESGRQRCLQTQLRKTRETWKANDSHAKRGKKLSETRRKEMRRILFGQKRETRMNVVTCKYTSTQIHHRYYALQRGYIVMQDCSEQGGERYNIYYDDLTKRGEVLERNLRKDGFEVKRYPDPPPAPPCMEGSV